MAFLPHSWLQCRLAPELLVSVSFCFKAGVDSWNIIEVTGISATLLAWNTDVWNATSRLQRSSAWNPWRNPLYLSNVFHTYASLLRFVFSVELVRCREPPYSFFSPLPLLSHSKLHFLRSVISASPWDPAYVTVDTDLFNNDNCVHDNSFYVTGWAGRPRWKLECQQDFSIQDQNKYAKEIIFIFFDFLGKKNKAVLSSFLGDPKFGTFCTSPYAASGRKVS